MAKIQFDIKYRDKIESGEYKVETREGLPVRIICWDRLAKKHNGDDINLCVLVPDDEGEAVYYYHRSGKRWVPNDDFDLFIVTPEEELSEFEERIFKLLRQYKECDIPLTPENIKAEASMLWQDFEKYFFDLYGKDGDGDSALRRFYYRGLADGKAEAVEKYKQSWFNEGKIAGRFEGLTEDEKYQQGVHDGKEEALKKFEAQCKVSSDIEHGLAYGLGYKAGKADALIDEITKLPGFKEDESHE